MVISLTSGFHLNQEKRSQILIKCCYSLGRFSLCFLVKSSAFLLNFFLSFVYSSARSARSGCSGSGSFTKAIRDCITEREANNHLPYLL